jgi:hypothetical protein
LSDGGWNPERIADLLAIDPGASVAVEDALFKEEQHPRVKGGTRAGQFTKGHGSGAAIGKGQLSFGFVSPNTKENLRFEQAEKELASPRQKEYHRYAQKLVGPRGRVHDVLGDWADGAENSLMIEGNMSREELRKAVAQVGLTGEQKAVIPFAADKNGKDVMWSLELGGQTHVNAVRQALSKHGLQFRTLQKTANGLTVHVFDEGGQMQRNILGVVKQLGGSITRTRGRGEFLGGDTRESGAREYQRVLGGAGGAAGAAS